VWKYFGLNAAGTVRDWCVVYRFGGGEACNRTRDFTQFFDSYYYNCFTYRAPAGHVTSGRAAGDDDDDAADAAGYSNLAEGLENGWSAVVLTGSSMLDQNVDEIRMIPGTAVVAYLTTTGLRTNWS